VKITSDPLKGGGGKYSKRTWPPWWREATEIDCALSWFPPRRLECTGCLGLLLPPGAEGLPHLPGRAVAQASTGYAPTAQLLQNLSTLHARGSENGTGIGLWLAHGA